MDRDFNSSIFFSDNERYADIINGIGCDGVPFVKGKDLHSLLDFTGIPAGLREKISNYQIHVVEVRKLVDTSRFKTDVKQVFDFIRFSGDKEKLRELMTTDQSYAVLEEDACDMVLSYVGEENMFRIKEKHKKGGKVDMCQGLKEWIEDERNEGKQMGENRFASLTQILITNGRTDDLLRAATDKEYRKKLFSELKI